MSTWARLRPSLFHPRDAGLFTLGYRAKTAYYLSLYIERVGNRPVRVFETRIDQDCGQEQD
jgi:hypothetical protein